MDLPRQRPIASAGARVGLQLLLETVPSIQVVVDPTPRHGLRVSRPVPRGPAPSPETPGSGPGGPPGDDGDPGNGLPEHPISIVLVDDVEGIRRLVRLALEDSEAFEVSGEASNGRQGIEVVEDRQPDLVLLDLSMPDMDGLEALPDLLEVAPDSKVAIYSGFKADRLEDTARELGAIGYLEKGLKPDELVSELVTLLEAHGESEGGADGH